MYGGEPPNLPPPSGPGGSTSLGIAPNLGGLLCYAPCCIGLIFSIVVAIAEKSSRFLRFHAFQSLLLHAAVLVLSVAVNIFLAVLGNMSSTLGFIGSAIWMLVGLGVLALQIYLMIKAYNLEEWEIPQLGPMARKWS
jgi:uncharacterized membrane protein